MSCVHTCTKRDVKVVLFWALLGIVCDCLPLFFLDLFLCFLLCSCDAIYVLGSELTVCYKSWRSRLSCGKKNWFSQIGFSN